MHTDVTDAECDLIKMHARCQRCDTYMIGVNAVRLRCPVCFETRPPFPITFDFAVRAALTIQALRAELEGMRHDRGA